MGKILVTGAAGFIGFHTSLRLQNVVGLDNLNDYYDPELKKARVKILNDNGIEVKVGNVADLTFLSDIVKKYQVEAIVHLAAQAGVRYSLINPQSYIESNINGFLSVLEVVRANPHIKLVYASSSSVYGQNEKVPYSIHDPTDSQASLYGVTKKSNELMAATYHHLYKIDATGLRFFTVYGPWGRPDMAYFSFTEKILKGETIELYNFGNCERDFTYIDDIVDGIQASLKLKPGLRIYNLGNHKPVKLLDFVAILENHLGKKANTILKPLQPGDVVKTYADITESEKDLGFTPKTHIDEGLKKFVEWHKSYFPNNP